MNRGGQRQEAKQVNCLLLFCGATIALFIVVNFILKDSTGDLPSSGSFEALSQRANRFTATDPYFEAPDGSLFQWSQIKAAYRLLPARLISPPSKVELTAPLRFKLRPEHELVFRHKTPADPKCYLIADQGFITEVVVPKGKPKFVQISRIQVSDPRLWPGGARRVPTATPYTERRLSASPPQTRTK